MNGVTSISPSSAIKRSRLFEAGLMLQTEAQQNGHASRRESLLRDSLYGQYFRGSSPSSWYFGRGLLQRLSTRARKSLAVRAVPQKRLATQELLQNRLISEAVFRQRLTISASYQRETPYKGGDLKRGILQEKLAHSRQHLQSQNHRRP